MKIIKITVGRSEDCSVRLSDNSVSRRHCALYFQDADHILIEDTNSTNGTKVFTNGKWQTVTGAIPVQLDTKIMLGGYATSAQQILKSSGNYARIVPASARIPPAAAGERKTPSSRVSASAKKKAAARSPRARPRRNPHTGEIIKG